MSDNKDNLVSHETNLVDRVDQLERPIERSVKGLRLRKDLQRQLDQLVFDQKMCGGKSGPELADEAIELLLHKYAMLNK